MGIATTYLFALVAGTRHQRFVFDDFEFAAAADRMGLVAQSKLAFYGFSGRTLLIAGGGASTSAGYGWAAGIAALSILGLIVGVTVLMKRVLSVSHTENRSAFYAASLATLALCLGTLPAREQVLYWIIGALVYITPMTLVVFGLCWVTQRPTMHADRKAGHRWWKPLVAFGSSVCIALGTGGNETVAAATVFGMLAIVTLAQRGSQMRRRALMMTPCSLIGAAIVYGAPGQRARASWVPVHRSTEASLNVAHEFWSAMSNLIITNIPVLFAAGLLGAFALSQQNDSTNPSHRFSRLALGLFVITIADWFALLVVASFGSMAVPPARAVTTPWCLTMFTALIAGAAVRERSSFAWLGSRVSLRQRERMQISVLGLVIVVACVIVPRISQTDRRLGGVAQGLDCIDRVLRQAARQPASDQSTVYIDAPELVNDIWFARKDPEQWPNKRMAEYYKLNKISNDPSKATPCRRPD